MPIVSGTAYWASVQAPNTHFDPKWTIELVVDKAEAAKLKDVMSAVTDNPKAQFQTIKKDEERGGWVVRIEQKCERADGTKNDPPRVVDSDGEPLDALVGNGSFVKVLYRAYKSTFKNKEYVKLGLKGVKVIELVPYGDPEDQDFFEPEDGSVEASKKKSSKADEFDDDL